MPRVIALDTGPLGVLSKARGKPDGDRGRAWLLALQDAEIVVLVPSIAVYEVRRELLRVGAPAALGRLEAVRHSLIPVPISDAILDLAAQLWADSRRAGLPTADPKALDGDAILAAQAIVAASAYGPDVEPIVATANPGHLSRFLRAEPWESILP